jgi:hypothetical protein
MRFDIDAPLMPLSYQTNYSGKPCRRVTATGSAFAAKFECKKAQPRKSTAADLRVKAPILHETEIGLRVLRLAQNAKPK